MTSSFGPFWYWKYDTLISLNCVAHFRPNSVRMILRPKGKRYILNMDLNHFWKHHLVHFGTGNMKLLYLSIVWLILDQIWCEYFETKKLTLYTKYGIYPFMTSSFGCFWYWKYDTLISLDCVAHFRPNLVRMILRPKGKLYLLNMDLLYLWCHHLVQFGTGNMTLSYLSMCGLFLKKLNYSFLETKR